MPTQSRGMTTGDIVAHLQDMYGSQVSKDLVSRVTDAVLADMAEWANRPLDPVYPVLLIDCIFVRIRDGQVANRPIYVAMASASRENATCWACGSAPPAGRAPRSGSGC